MAHYYQLSVTTGTPNKTTIKEGLGKLKGIFCSAATQGSNPRLTVHDSATQTAADGTILSIVTPQASENYLLSGADGGIGFSRGLYVLTAGTMELTFIYE